MERAETQDEAEDEDYGVDSDGYSVSEELARRAARLAKIRALAQPSQTDHLARTLHLVSPNLTTTVELVLTGASLAIEWGGGLHWLVPTVLVAVVGGVLSAWLFLVEQV